MTFACRRCRQTYELATIMDVIVWMAVEPWEKGLCAACEIEPARKRR